MFWIRRAWWRTDSFRPRRDLDDRLPLLAGVDLVRSRTRVKTPRNSVRRGKQTNNVDSTRINNINTRFASLRDTQSVWRKTPFSRHCRSSTIGRKRFSPITPERPRTGQIHILPRTSVYRFNAIKSATLDRSLSMVATVRADPLVFAWKIEKTTQPRTLLNGVSTFRQTSRSRRVQRAFFFV